MYSDPDPPSDAVPEKTSDELRQRLRLDAPARGAPRPPRRRGALALIAGLSLGAVATAASLLIVLAGPGGGGDPSPNPASLPRWFGMRPPWSEPPVPIIQPTVLIDASPDAARSINAAIPFAGPVPPARPFNYPGSPENRAAARRCLAAAVLYEAGNDPVGQYAVAQVVVNRVRHPAFAKTVCGVVFQGSERPTGCQFTFTCDGSLARRPNQATWSAALASADAALAGFVFSPVGTATHYHADWVVPNWESSLVKLTAIHGHIFYRWPGWWGTTPAFSGGVAGDEVVNPRLLAAIAKVDIGAPTAATTTTSPVGPPVPILAAEPPQPRVPGMPAGLLKGNTVRFTDDAGSTVVLLLDPKAYPGSFAILANAICTDKPECLVVGFVDDAAAPRSMPRGDAIGRADFIFRRRTGADAPEMAWNCTAFPRANLTRCRDK